MKIITTDKSPIPKGHYSQAIEHNGVLYVSGQLAIDPKTDKPVVGTIGQEMEQIFRNFEAILFAANTTKEKVLKVNIYVSDISLWPEVNDIYSRFFGNHKPARAIVPVKKLHYDLNIEMDAIVAAD
jgi:2-iminobutanoate/2-iminopropanoate deaminase